MTIALVGSPTVSTDGTDAARTLGTGNLLVIFCTWEDSDQHPSGATVGGTSASGLTGAHYTTGEVGVKIFYFPSTVSGSKTISVTWNVADLSRGWVALEFSGVATTSPLEVQSALGGTSATTSPTTTNANSTTTANSLLVGVIKNYIGSTTIPNSSPSTWNEAYEGSSSPVYGTEVQYLVVSSAAVYQCAGTISSAKWAAALATFKENPAGTIEQKNFRFRNDDNNEATATWKANQDTNITLAADTAARIRMLLNATGDPNSIGAQLEYRYKPSGGAFGSWTKVN